MVEGGAATITSMLAAKMVDRLVVSISPMIIGSGVEAVGNLGVRRVVDGVRLTNQCAYVAGDDLLLGWDVQSAP
jgi:riboflavin biosynthesis pyrimidine reductase